jgi:apolipoprotein N-acyltransferase
MKTRIKTNKLNAASSMSIRDFIKAGWRANLLAAIAGAVVPLAFAPFDLFPLALLAPALLFLLWLDVSAKSAFRRGYLFGVGMFGFGVPWVYVSMSQFGGVALPLAVFLTALFILFLALFPALVGYVFARFFSSSSERVKLLVVLPVLWTLVEWVRGWIFTGFPWLALGYSQIDSPLHGYGSLLGVYGISWLTVLGAGLLAYIVRHKSAWQVSLPALLAIFALGWLLSGIHWTNPKGAPVRVALLQGNISQDQKWRPEMRQPTIDLYVDMTRANWDSDIIVWPETALPAFLHQAETFLAQLGEEARKHHTDLLIGIPVMDSKNGNYYNSVVSVGSKEAVYKKTHLVPFGEFIPFQSILGNVLEVLNVPLPDFSKPDSKQPLLSVAGHKVGMSICYEDVFGEEVIDEMPEASMLVNVSNDAWFGKSVAPHQHMQIARMRALETGRPLLRDTNTGVTAIIEPDGSLQATLPQFEAAALTGVVQPMVGMTPYARVGNWLIVSLLFIMAIGSYLTAQLQHRKDS